MVEELLVTSELSKEMIEAGADLTKRLSTHVNIQAAFWFFLTDNQEWRLIFATPEVRINGPKAVYKKIQTNLNKIPVQQRIPLRNVAVTEPNSALVELIGSVISTGNNISNIRFKNNVINGQFIDDVFIYKINIQPRNISSKTKSIGNDND